MTFESTIRTVAGFRRRAAEAERQDEFPGAGLEIDFPGECNVAVLRSHVLPVHSAVPREILPAVAHADETRGAPAPRRGTDDRERVAGALREQHLHALVLIDPGAVAAPTVAQVRGCEHVQMVVFEAADERHEARALQHRVAARVGKDLLLDAIAPDGAAVHQPIERHAGRGVAQLRAGMTFLLGEELPAIGDNETQVAGAGRVESRVVDLVEDAVAQCEPDATGARERRTDTRLGARRPARFRARPAGCVGSCRAHGADR